MSFLTKTFKTEKTHIGEAVHGEALRAGAGINGNKRKEEKRSYVGS